MAEADKVLPENQPFAPWFAKEQASLQEQATQRDKNLVIAIRLLPLFEAQPAGWETLPSLKRTTKEINVPLPERLREWQVHTREDQRPLIDKLLALFTSATK